MTEGTEGTVRESTSISTQAERSALSDQKMFEVAIDLVNERGTAKTTLKDIGEQAGYSRGLARNQFSYHWFFLMLALLLMN